MLLIVAGPYSIKQVMKNIDNLQLKLSASLTGYLFFPGEASPGKSTATQE